MRSNTDRVDNNDALTPIVEDAFVTLTAEKVMDLLERAGIANARLRTPEEFTRLPRLRARDRWREVETPAGPIRAARTGRGGRPGTGDGTGTRTRPAQRDDQGGVHHRRRGSGVNGVVDCTESPLSGPA
ncbi:CoA transferase [Streptomyces cavernae]|uniref:CoA transferase n=1 Tax=Streptomyces cavernae TaxID=2259034 RepID=UPI002367E2A0|nr:CoA transferase [Streptomyces cavernae]